MIDVAAVRAKLADRIRAALVGGPAAGVAVHEVTPDGTTGFPAVVLGMPSWRPGANFCLDEQELPVVVVVAQDGTTNAGVVSSLDELWPAVVVALKAASSEDPTLGGLVAEWHLDRADFGSFVLGNASLPAQNITLTLNG